MLVYVVSSSLDLNWLLGLLGLGEKRAPISDHSNTLLHQFILLLVIIIGVGWLLHQLGENRETNPNAIEVYEDDHTNDDELLLDHYFESQQGDQGYPSGELDHYFDVDDRQLCHRTATPRGGDTARQGACAFCGILCTTRCSRCKAARYCSMECQIGHWRAGHKYECSESKSAADEAKLTHDHGKSKLVKKCEKENTSNNNGSHGDGVWWNSESTDVVVDVSRGNDVNTFHGCEVGVLKKSHEEGQNIHSSGPHSLEFHPEGTTHFKSPMKVSQDPTKEAQLHRTKWIRHLEEEVAKSRNEILLLETERDEWKNRANFARERFQSMKKESNYQLFVLKNEKESILDAEKKACNVIHSLHERLNHLQNKVKERNAEKRKLEEHIQKLESESAKLKKELQEEHKRAQCLTMESDKSHEIVQIAKREVEAIRVELKKEREHGQRLAENSRRDVIFAESRASFVEVCSICLTNEKDLAFGCGHMTCRDCGSKLSKCPICREQITNHIRLFSG
ncbi:hypothetical protein VNO77_39010 [Canavalia gladiata]|uniref:Uncharacterized protein n=1 Tax=Canavalia gladiata TaxID=3824 RepID=A0AAN9KBR7_CANGL